MEFVQVVLTLAPLVMGLVPVLLALVVSSTSKEPAKLPVPMELNPSMESVSANLASFLWVSA